MRFMERFNLNAVQLDVSQDRFPFYDSIGGRYGLCDLHTLASSTATLTAQVDVYELCIRSISEEVPNRFGSYTTYS